MVLQGQPCGRVGRCRGFEGPLERAGLHLFGDRLLGRNISGLLSFWRSMCFGLLGPSPAGLVGRPPRAALALSVSLSVAQLDASDIEQPGHDAQRGASDAPVPSRGTAQLEHPAWRRGIARQGLGSGSLPSGAARLVRRGRADLLAQYREERRPLSRWPARPGRRRRCAGGDNPAATPRPPAGRRRRSPPPRSRRRRWWRCRAAGG